MYRSGYLAFLFTIIFAVFMVAPLQAMEGGIVTIGYVIGGMGQMMWHGDAEATLMGITMTKGLATAWRHVVAPPRGPRRTSQTATCTPVTSSFIVAPSLPIVVLTVELPPPLATGGPLASRRGPTIPPRHFVDPLLNYISLMRRLNRRPRSPDAFAVLADIGALFTGSTALLRLPTAVTHAAEGRAIAQTTSLANPVVPHFGMPSTLAMPRSEVDCGSRKLMGGGRRLGRSAPTAGLSGAMPAAVASLQFTGLPRGLGRPIARFTI